jgi:hypothetical protein
MSTAASDQRLELEAHRTIVLQDVRDAEIVCTSGQIWITEGPLRSDIVLEAGAAHVVRADGKTYVTAFDDSTVRVRRSLPARVPPRAAHFASLLDAISRRATGRRLATD